MLEFVLFKNVIILWFYLIKQRNCCSPLGPWYGSKKQDGLIPVTSLRKNKMWC